VDEWKFNTWHKWPRHHWWCGHLIKFFIFLINYFIEKKDKKKKNWGGCGPWGWLGHHHLAGLGWSSPPQGAKGVVVTTPGGGSATLMELRGWLKPPPWEWFGVVEPPLGPPMGGYGHPLGHRGVAWPPPWHLGPGHPQGAMATLILFFWKLFIYLFLKSKKFN
jgi:hypothetical protein